MLTHYRVSHEKVSIKNFYLDLFTASVDDYAKDGGSEVVWHLCSFTKILCGRNFCVWYVTKIKCTRQLQMASLSLSSIWKSDVKSQSY